MSTFSVPIEISDPTGMQWLRLDALVDTGSTICAVPASLLHSLNVQPSERRSFEFAQGEVREMVVGDIRVRFEGNNVITPVMFNEEGTEPLLGAMALERAFLGVDPIGEKLVPIIGLGRAGRAWRRR